MKLANLTDVSEICYNRSKSINFSNYLLRIVDIERKMDKGHNYWRSHACLYLDR
jgi:hypothetical protein